MNIMNANANENENENANANANDNKIYRPIQFWFTEPGLAIPFVALQYSDVKHKLVRDIIDRLSKTKWLELRTYNNFVLEDTNNKKNNYKNCEEMYETLHNFLLTFS